MTAKTSNNNDYLRELILNVEKSAHIGKSEEKSNLIKAIEKSFEYLKKKSIINRDKWVVIFTDKFEINENKEEKIIKNFLKFFENVNISVVIVGIKMKKNESEFLSQILKKCTRKNRSEYIDYENISRLKSIFKINGIIRDDDKIFLNERYQSEKLFE